MLLQCICLLLSALQVGCWVASRLRATGVLDWRIRGGWSDDSHSYAWKSEERMEGFLAYCIALQRIVLVWRLELAACGEMPLLLSFSCCLSPCSYALDMKWLGNRTVRMKCRQLKVNMVYIDPVRLWKQLLRLHSMALSGKDSFSQHLVVDVSCAPCSLHQHCCWYCSPLGQSPFPSLHSPQGFWPPAPDPSNSPNMGH